MSSQFGFVDIILLALFAGFIILRLRNILGRKTGHQGKSINRYFTKIENYFEEQGISNSREHYNSWRKDPNSSREIYDEENDSFGIVGHVPNISSRGIDVKLEERILSIVSEIENIRRNHFHETFFS